MSEVNMPRLSDTMQEGTIAHWLKKPGDEVKKGDVLAEIETDKATMELEAYDSGVLEQILVQEGETVRIGQAVAIIGSGGGVQKQEQPAVQETDKGAQKEKQPVIAEASTDEQRQDQTEGADTQRRPPE
ncbi:MAG: biotin/lipoyl-binding protein, partial [Chloroflexi bacterium]